MMDDLISRQAAIDAIKNQTCLTYEEIFNRCLTNIRDENGWVGGIKDAIEAAIGLPSVQPDWGKPVGDGRPLADGEIIARLQDIKKQIGGSYAIDRAIEVLKGLPSAKSECNEWCTDCKEYDQEAHCCHRYSSVIKEAIDELQVVRCKDCKAYDSHDKRCKVWNHGVAEYEYCYRGGGRNE